ncbi:MAG: TAXI family TRAP transporter solute-binding subunit [Thermodesulfobacteriota bacterium]
MKAINSRLTLGVLAAAVMGLAWLAGQPVQAADQVNLTIAAGSPGGVYFKNAAAYGEIIKKVIPGASVTVTSGGGMANAERLDSGDADIGILENAVATLGFRGEPPAKKKYNYRMIAAFSGPSRAQAMILEKSGVKRFEEIKAKKYPLKVAMFEKHQLATQQAEAVFNAYGITFDDIKSWGGYVTFGSINEGFRQMEDGIVEMWFTGSSFSPHPKFIEMGTKQKFRLLPISKEVAEKVGKKFGQPIVEVPADIYKDFNGTNEPYWTMDTTLCFAVKTNMPEDVAYKLTKALVDYKDDLYAVHQQNKYYKPETAWQGVGECPLHPGAARFYKEKGYMK